MDTNKLCDTVSAGEAMTVVEKDIRARTGEEKIERK